MRVEREVHVNDLLLMGSKWKLPITYVQRIAWHRVNFLLFRYIYIYTYIYTRCKGPLVDNSRVMWLRGGAYVPTTVVEYESITDDRLSTRVKVHNATK